MRTSILVVPLMALAMSFASSASLLARDGRVTLENSGGNWRLSRPDGQVEAIGNSKCGGLPEAILLATENGFELEVIGGAADPGSRIAAINCGVGLKIGPLAGAKWRIGAIDLIFSPDVRHAITFDTGYHNDIEWLGRIGFSGTDGAALNFFPQSPIGSTIAFKHNLLKFQRVLVTGGTGSAGALFQPTLGDISGNKIDFNEIEGGGGETAFLADGIRVLSPKGGNSFSYNKIESRPLMYFTGSAARIGTEDPKDGYLDSNIWELDIEAAFGAAPRGVVTWEREGLYTLSLRHGRLSPGVELQRSATNNIFLIKQNKASRKLIDLSPGRTNTFIPSQE